MPNDNLHSIAIGNVNTGGSAVATWPQTWEWPQNYFYPIYHSDTQDYANEVQVERGEHDAVLRFYRKREKSRSLVKEITVPLSVLDWLTDKEGT